MYGARSVSPTNRGLEPGKVTTMGEAHDCESSYEALSGTARILHGRHSQGKLI